MKSSDLTSKNSRSDKTKRAKRRPYTTRRRFRVEIINENTLSRIWSVKLSGIKAILAAIATVAAIVSLVFVIIGFTPLKNILPGQLKGDLRGNYLETALRIDSLEQITRKQNAYTHNIANILTDNIDTTRISPEGSIQSSIPVDSLLTATDEERRFVQQFEEEERFNLSVLSPIAAEGMIFEAPTYDENRVGEINAVYRGTVIGQAININGTFSVIIQHPNDFISVYDNLSETFVKKGSKVVAGQRIGRTTSEHPLTFELWHKGSSLDPSLYVPF